jgi:hypothetical protein
VTFCARPPTRQFQEPVRLPKGARLHAVAHWDNSRNNPSNPATEKTVKFGLQKWNEMMVGWVAYVYERPEEAAALLKQPVSQADLLFDRFDRNGDGVITADEFPDQVKLFMAANGIKAPDKMDRKQFAEFFEELRKKMPARRPKPADGAEKKP